MVASPKRLSEPAPAKINLFLQISGRRGDGYHLLDSLFVFTDFGDELTYQPEGEFILSVAGLDVERGTGNLVHKAAHRLADTIGRQPAGLLHLEKRIPVAAGLGGGSADAAAALRLLNRAWQAELGEEDMGRIALELGADVPACLYSTSAHVGGIGERISSVDLPRLHGVLVNPNVPLATSDVFRAYRAAGYPFHDPVAEIPSSRDVGGLISFLETVGNDLQPFAMALEPAVSDVIAALDEAEGTLFSRMSGSGPTCFGLYADRAAAAAAAEQIAQAHPAWWVQPTVTL